MKKIGITTTSGLNSGTFNCNYGAALQGYALVKQLRLMGYDAHDINYSSRNEYDPKNYGLIERTLRRIPMLFSKKLVSQKINEYRNRKNIKINFEVFRKFVSDNDITYNGGQSFMIEDLENIAGDFYAFITGSDVVWNPYLRKNKNDEGYFLRFVPENVKRIAYAPSIGVSVLPEESKSNLKEYLEDFDALSVRESTGAKLIKDTTGIDVAVVLDPTLLLDPDVYNEIMVCPEDLPEKYIAVYKFGGLEHTSEKIKEISERLNMPVVYIPSNCDVKKQRYDFGPGEFVGVIKNASFVITDSFHCTVFSVLLHTPFLTFNRTLPMSGKNINSRMTDLLHMIGLDDRMVGVGADIDYERLFEIDFKSVDEILKEKRAESFEYLKKALGK